MRVFRELDGLKISGYVSHIKEQGTLIECIRRRRTGAAEEMTMTSFYTSREHVNTHALQKNGSINGNGMYRSVLGERRVMEHGYEQNALQIDICGVNQVQRAERTSTDYLSTRCQALILD